MNAPVTVTSPPFPQTGSPPWVRFALLGTLFLLLALGLEPYLAPLCRVTAAQVGALLALAGHAPRVQGELVELSGFTVRIVTECTPLYPVLLYGALILAHPAPWGRALAGLLFGGAAIAAANLLRISLVTAAGSGLSPLLFDVLHVYLGQVAMLVAVLWASLSWLRWNGQAPAPAPFLLRAFAIATLLFVPWLVLNRPYVALLDHLVALLFSLLYPGHLLVTPRPFPIYNHTFALPLYLSLTLASSGVFRPRTLFRIAAGGCLLAGWHALFRVTHVCWTALDAPEIEPLHQGVYLFGQFLIPFLLWLLQAPPGRQLRISKGVPAAFLAFVVTLGAGSEALAGPLVSVYWDGRGAFTVMGNQFNRVLGVELSIGYRSESQAPPRVIGRGPGAKAAIEADVDTPGSLKVQVKSDTPLSGNVLLASIAPLAGDVTHVTAWLRNDKGTMESAGVKIVNPTDEQLDKLEGRQRAIPDAARAPLAAAVSQPREAREQTAAAAAAAEAPKRPMGEEKRSSPVFRRRPSVLELFRAHDGARSEAALAALFGRSDEMFAQRPSVLLSDGRASLTLAIRTPGDRAPRFVIAGGDCTGLKIGEEGEGEWLLEIVPARGALEASVTVLTDEAMIEFPLAVAPPLEQFDTAAAPPGVAEYVGAANRLAYRNRVAK